MTGFIKMVFMKNAFLCTKRDFDFSTPKGLKNTPSNKKQQQKSRM